MVLLFSKSEYRAGEIRILGLGLDASRSDNRRVLHLQERAAGFYDELRVPLFRYLLSMRVTPEEAEEIIQESFLRLYKHLHGGGQEDNLRGWIYRVAHNLSSTRRRERRFLADVSPDEWEQISVSATDPKVSPEEVLLHKERMRRLHRDIAGLSELQRNCIRLRIEGFRYQEITRILNVSTSTVAGSIRHAIGRLTQGS